MGGNAIEIQQQKVRTFYSRHGRAKKTHFSLCGLAINEEGKVTESEMFHFLGLDPEEYGHILLTADEARKVHYRLQGVKWGGAAAKVPLYCGGEKICPFAQDMVKLKKHPRLDLYHTTRTAVDRRRLAKTISGVLRGIEAGVFFPNPGWMCGDCQHSRACVEWSK